MATTRTRTTLSLTKLESFGPRLLPPELATLMAAPGTSLEVVRSRQALAQALARPGRTSRLALVPTMGALHEGHLSLVERAREHADRVAVSLFVNPLQFGPGEDFERYPRSEEQDLALLEARGADLVYAPPPSDVYPGGDPVVTVDPGPPGERLCGAFRPGHFAGVLTVVAKLFGLFRPQVAVFGRKDYQQSVLIRRMVADLEMGVEILVAPTLRESDGLALSSRNAYLDPAERAQAVGLFQSLEAARERFAAGERSAGAIVDAMRQTLAGFPALRPQYVELVHPETLEATGLAAAESVVALAAHLGRTRLIDNAVLG